MYSRSEARILETIKYHEVTARQYLGAVDKYLRFANRSADHMIGKWARSHAFEAATEATRNFKLAATYRRML